MGPTTRTPPPSAAGLPPGAGTDAESAGEACLRRFVTACRTRGVPPLAELPDWLTTLPASEQAPTLVDLAGEHLYLRRARGEPACVEDYIRELGPRFAEFRSPAVVPAELIEREFLARHEFGDHADRDEYSRRFPSRPNLLKSLDHRTLDGGRYLKVRLQGKGGLGLVWLACDHHLDRVVALKEPRPALAGDGPALRRLADEARVTAGLDHPSIVAVHEYRRDGAAPPYYVMRLVQGRTLHEVIRQYHQGGLPAGQRRLLWDRLVQSFVTICGALAHAHDRGVLHRDLKPQNVVLGDFGETVVLDWGLAKHVAGRPTPGALPGQVTEAAPPAGADVAAAAAAAEARAAISTIDYPAPTPPQGTLTAEGQLIGTPAYMAPEQAWGQNARIGPLTDVYGLGAIFHEILTGQPPYSGRTQLEVLGKVRAGPPERPSQVKSNVPAALEAVCLKAMAREPEDRYAGATALAEDVRHWLADEPVSSYREPRARWLLRQARRHPRGTGVSLTLVLLALMGLPAWLTASQLERNRERRQVEELVQVGDRDLVAGLVDQARASLIEARTRAANRPDLADLGRRAEDGLKRVEGRGRRDQFQQAAREAEYHLLGAYWTLRPHEDPDDRNLAIRDRQHGPQLEAGVRLAEKALALYGLPEDRQTIGDAAGQGLAEQDAQEVRGRAGELLVMLALGKERLAQGGPAPVWDDARREAVTLLRTAEALDHRGRSLYQSRARFQRDLGQKDLAEADERQARATEAVTLWDLHQQTFDLRRSQRWTDGLRVLQQARNLRPGEFWTLFRMAGTYEKLRKFVEAESLYRTCLDQRPGDTSLRNNLGKVLSDQRRWPEASEEFETALRESPDYLAAYGNLMLAHAEQKNSADAEAVLRRFLARQPPPVQQAQGWNNLGLAFERAGDYQGAERHYQTAVRLDPADALAWRNLALVRNRLERFAEAEAGIQKAIALDEKDPDCHYVLGNILAAQKRNKEAERAYTAALKLDPSFRAARTNRGQVLCRLGRLDDSLTDLSAVLEQQPNDPVALYDRALTLAAQKQFRAALDDINRALDFSPDDPEFVLMRGQVWGDLGVLDESQRDLNRAVQLAPNNPMVYHARAITLLKAKDWNGALRDFRKYLQLEPNAPDAPSILNDISNALEGLGQQRAALQALNQSLALRDDPVVRANRANRLLRLGDTNRALEDVAAALTLKPGNLRAQALRGESMLRLGRFDQALAEFDRVLRSGVALPLYELLLLRALAHQGRGDREAAQADLDWVARERPDHVRGKFARGVRWLHDGKFADAIQELGPATEDLTLRPWALALHARAWLGVRGGGVQGALDDADRLAEGFGTEGFALLEAARIHAQALPAVAAADGDRVRDRALTLLENALQRQPDLRAALKEDAELAPLRDQPRFKTLAAGE